MRFGVVLAAIIAVTPAISVAADPAPTPAPVYTMPTVIERPSAAATLETWPKTSLQGGRDNAAKLYCTITTSGEPRDCVVIGLMGAFDKNFAAAALQLVHHVRLAPATHDGKAIEVGWPVMVSWCRNACTGQAKRMVARDPFLSAPTSNDVEKAYPRKARQAGIAGDVVLACVQDQCEVASEAPLGHGFGQAALSLKPKFRRLGKDPYETKIHFGPVPDAERGKLLTIKELFTHEFMVDHFPMAAAARGVNVGHATVRCTVKEGGRVTGCEVKSETPAGLGFGRASVQAAEQTLMALWTDAGTPTVGGVVDLPIEFSMLGEREPGAAAAAPPMIPAVVVRYPTDKEVAKVYPIWSKSHSQGADLSIVCTATAQGTTSNCTMAKLRADSGNMPSVPVNVASFNKATPKIGALYRVQPASFDGVPFDSRIELKISVDVISGPRRSSSWFF
jgi:hypothetical protein